VHPVASLEDLAAELDLSKLSQSASRFDEAELLALSARTLHAAPFAAVAGRLEKLGVAGPQAEAFWLAVRGNLNQLDDAAKWWEVAFGEIDGVREDEDLLAKAAEALPQEPWGPQTWGEWTAALKGATGRKGRALFHPLRLALTGAESGPELAALLPLIGRERASSRLRGPSS
jgi:glutamyl-tRNA synthetase